MKNKINHYRRISLQFLTKPLSVSSSYKKKIEDDFTTKPVRILISRPNSRLGNLVLVTPLIQEIESIFPNAKIDLFVRSGVAKVIFQNYKSINAYIILPTKPFKQLFKYFAVWFKIRKSHYDIVFNTISNSSSGRLSTKFAKSDFQFAGDVDEKLFETFTDYKHMAKLPVYNFRFFLQTIGYNNIQLDKEIPCLSLKLSTEELKNGKALLDKLTANTKKTIAIYTFATGAKCLSKAWWAEMYNKLQEEYGEQYNILEVLPKENVSQIDFAAINYYSQNIREMAAVVANTEIFVTGDCGVMHLESAAGTPVLGLFSTSPIEGYKPYNKGSKALDTNTCSHQDVLKDVREILDTNSKQ